MTSPLDQTHSISPDRWERIQDVLGAAIECDAGDRSRLLDHRCAGDPDLRREVESLLAAHDGTGLVDQLAEAMEKTRTWARDQTSGWAGCRVGQYAVSDLLGAGGMGLVYKARDERLGRHVALKFLPPHLSTQPAAKARFLAEARAAAALDHPNICTIHEIGETADGHLFIAMPLYEGDTLQTRLARGRLPFGEASLVAIQIARALECAHERSIVHRDIKPSNVMLLGDGTVKIVDFGIATMDEMSAAGFGSHFGTIAYMSPEHVRGGLVDHRADIWSLGVLLHEMLSGVRPFRGVDRLDVSRAILDRDPDLIATSYPDVPAAVDDVLRRALAKEPEDRYASMASFASDLIALSSGSRSQNRPDAAAPPATERRRAAVLVSTISSYPALVEHLAPADAQRLVAGIRDITVDVVRRHGGLVNQAIDEETVSLFGVPTAHEDDELRAVRAALELHARVREIAVSAAPGVAVRVQSGIHAGLVVAQRLAEGPRRYAIVGAPTQAAARLAALAPADAVVLSPECQRLVAPFVSTVPCAPAILEPASEPVTPHRVTGETGLETRLQASERVGLTRYVGRGSELACLERHVARARDGTGATVAVIGDAGAGKSRLLHELRLRVSGEGVRFLQGRCRAYGDAPYIPFIEIVRDALGVRGPATNDERGIVAALRALDSALEPFIPLYLHLLSVPSEAHPLPRHLPGEHLQAALLDALVALMSALAARDTLVVLLEDWHWSDAASRAALARMVDCAATRPLLLVVTTRPERGVLGESLAPDERLYLEPLDARDSSAILKAVLQVERISDDFAQRVFEHTGGNPFFLEQVSCALAEQGAVAIRGGEAVVEGGLETLFLPDTVQAVIRTRLDKLEPAAREVLRIAAAIGREFSLELLADVLPPHLDLLGAVARLEAAGLIRQTSAAPAASFRFTHVLTQEVGYESLVGHQRKSLHDAIGRAIERHHADRLDENDEKAALLAHHFCRAEAWPDAIRYGRRAADRASALSQFGDAVAALDQVLEWLPHLRDDGRDQELHDLRADVLLEQERACETLGLRRRQHEIIAQLITHLADRGASSRLAQTCLREGDLLTLLKRFDAADLALGKALRISRELGDTALERSALRSVGLLRWHEGRHAEALAITEVALAIDRECRDELAVAGDLTNLSNIHRSMGDYAVALPRLEEALTLPSLAQDPKKLAYALHALANVHRGMGNLEPAVACLHRADEIARANLLPIQRSFHLTSIAHIHLQEGRIDAAVEAYREAIGLSRRARHAAGLAQSLRMLGEVLFGFGREGDALPYLQEAAALFAQLEDLDAEAAVSGRVAAILERAHRPAEAADTWKRVHLLRRRTGDAEGQLDALEGRARAIRQLPESDAAAVEVLEAALALASALGATRRALAHRNALGILEWKRERYAEALAHYEAALLLVRDHGDYVEEGLILNSLGATLTKLHRLDAARVTLEESVALNRETGERLLEAHALAALARVFRTIDRPDRALACLEQSLALRRVAGDRTGEGWMLHRIAEARAALGEDSAARQAAAAASRIAAETGDANLIAACGTAPRAGTLYTEDHLT